MSKRFISVTAGAIAFAAGGAAFAADLPVRAAPPASAPVPYASVPYNSVPYTWIELYIRASAAPNWPWNVVEPSGTVAFVNPGFSVNAPGAGAVQIAAIPPALSTSANGIMGGGQLGYDSQWVRSVPGVEADFSGLTGRGFNTANTFAKLGAATTAQSCTFVPTGCAVPLPGTAATPSKTSTGWALGQGVDTSWSLKAEYLRYDLGKYATTPLANTVSGGPFTTTTSAAKFQGDFVRAGLSYQFH